MGQSPAHTLKHGTPSTSQGPLPQGIDPSGVTIYISQDGSEHASANAGDLIVVYQGSYLVYQPAFTQAIP